MENYELTEEEKRVAEEEAQHQEELNRSLSQPTTGQQALNQDLSEIEDPRNKENWGLGEVAQELGAAFGGGLQDTASSIITAPERAIDMATGEMGTDPETGETINTRLGGVYDPDTDDFLFDPRDKIETKTWWGELVRGTVHFGSMAVALAAAVKAAPLIGIGAGAAATTGGLAGLGRAGWGMNALRGLLSGARIGAATDILSIRSQEDNALGALAKHYPGFDNVLATNNSDSPMMKTLKNVTEGLGIGVVFEGAWWGLRRIGGKDIWADSVKINDLRRSRYDQTISKAEQELIDTPNEIRGSKDKGTLAEPYQGAHGANGHFDEAMADLDAIRNDWLEKDGSITSITSADMLERAAKKGMNRNEVLEDVLKQFYSSRKATLQASEIVSGTSNIKEKWYGALKTFQRIGLGREAADQTPEEYLKEFFTGTTKWNEGTPEEIVAWSSKHLLAADLVTHSLARELRDLGIAGQELAKVGDIRKSDGVVKSIFDKFVTATTEIQRTKLLTSPQFRELGVGDATKTQFDEVLNKQVEQTIDGLTMALDIAYDSNNNDMFEALFEIMSMSNSPRNLDDFNAYMRSLIHGERGKTPPKFIEELGGVMANSILSGPKTPMRAILGTGSVTFLRPVSMAIGAGLSGDFKTMKASLASTNAMMQAIPEAFTLFQRRIKSHWAGDIANVKSRYYEASKGDESWELVRQWVENSGQATAGDRAAFNITNIARTMNDNRILTWSPKVMSSADDATGYLLARGKAKEKAYREAMEKLDAGDIPEITPEIVREYENRFLATIMDANGNIMSDAVQAAKKEVTMTQDLTGFAKGLEQVFNSTPWTKPFFLFARTGVNGLNLTAKHTPIMNRFVAEHNAIMRATPDNLADVARYGITNANELANAKALARGRTAIGSAVIMSAGFAYMNGNLTGNGPTDRTQRQMWLDAGWRPRRIKIGDAWVSYDAFEPFNQILSTIGDIGDHQQLMGEEWTENQFQKIAMIVAQGVTNKSYLSGMGDFVDFVGGAPGAQDRIIGNMVNNVFPMAGARNELGKIISPGMKELNSGILESIQNRNQWLSLFGVESPVKHDFLTGQPIQDHDFMTRMFNAVSPVHVNLDYSPGKRLLFESGFDLRLSTYSSPSGVDLSEAPALRSQFQLYIGRQNLQLKLDRLADDPRILESLAQMKADIDAGKRDIDAKEAYYHLQVIERLFKQARNNAWKQMLGIPEIQEMIEQERLKRIEEQRRLRRSTQIEELANLPSK